MIKLFLFSFGFSFVIFAERMIPFKASVRGIWYMSDGCLEREGEKLSTSLFLIGFLYVSMLFDRETPYKFLIISYFPQETRT